jgi:hypothetical protein
LLAPLVAREQARLKAAGSIAGDVELQLPDAGRELPAAKAIPVLAPVRSAFEPLCPDELAELAFDGLADQRRQHGAERVGRHGYTLLKATAPANPSRDWSSVISWTWRRVNAAGELRTQRMSGDQFVFQPNGSQSIEHHLRFHTFLSTRPY